LPTTRFTYGGRGYLRFAALAVPVPSASGMCEVSIDRAGPGRVHISILAADPITEEAVDALAERVRSQVVAFCQAPIRDFGKDTVEHIADDGSKKRNLFARTLASRVELDVRVPSEHQSDMRPDDVSDLRDVIATRPAIPARLVASLDHSLLQATSDVEAFLAVYSVLQSVLGKQADVDSFILAAEPNCEMATDSRGRQVTIYTKLRNAKGHPTGMPPQEASERISRLLPTLRQHAKSALFR